MPQTITSAERLLGEILGIVDDFSVRRDEHLRRPRAAVQKLNQKLAPLFQALNVATVPALVGTLDAMERGTDRDSDLRTRLRYFIENCTLNPQDSPSATQLNLLPHAG